jgi:hypothetical protein
MPIICAISLLPWPRFGPKSSTPTSGARQERLERRLTMFTKVREGSRYGARSVLGDLVEELRPVTSTADASATHWHRLSRNDCHRFTSRRARCARTITSAKRRP